MSNAADDVADAAHEVKTDATQAVKTAENKIDDVTKS
jgi:hypothetical protein